jgi:hypothetical protein
MAAETDIAALARLRTLLASGVRSTTVDGVSTSFDMQAVREEITRLEIKTGLRRRRSRVLTVNMGRR